MNLTKLTMKLILPLLASCAVNSVYADEFCKNSGNAHDLAICDGKILEDFDVKLKAIYEEELSLLPDQKYVFDNRKTRSQLTKSQNSWLSYRYENCGLVGGLEGGDSVSITILSTECAIQETKKRMEFLKNLPKGG